MELRAKRSLLLALALTALLAPAAQAKLVAPASQVEPPTGYSRSAAQVIAVSKRDAKVVDMRAKHPKLAPSTYENGPGRWQVSWFAGKKELAQVQIDDRTGAVVESWTGPQVAWRMARGYPGAFGRKLNAPYVWIPLCLLFIAPFFDFRRPFRLLHLDLLVLLGFGASHFFFNRGEISTSVPLAYPVLLYLLARLAWVGFRGARARPGKLVPHLPMVVLVLAIIFLSGFRVALNVADSNVIDVGYAGVVGADKIVDGHELYDGKFPADNERGDTYGPVNYLAYVPFEQAMPWSGAWDDLPAAHGAALVFDFLTMIGLFFLGRRMRAGPPGKRLGIVLAFAWAAYPYTLFALESNSNDSLVAAALVGALLLITSPAGRGAMVALGGAAKFAPLALAPLFARGTGPWRWRSALVFAGVTAAVIAAGVLPFLPDTGLRGFFDRTLGSQLGRESPFSIWGQEGWNGLHTAVKVLGLGLALAVGVVPRRRSVVQVAALGAAVMIALQLAMTHWFYLYIVWFFPFAIAALFCEYERPAGGAPRAAAGTAQRPEPAAELQPA